MPAENSDQDYFIVTYTPGNSYDQNVPLGKQVNWRDHAEFMDSLVAEGTVVLGGPVGDGIKRIVIMKSIGYATLMEKLASDPWIIEPMLTISRALKWNKWIDRLGVALESKRKPEGQFFLVTRHFGPKWDDKKSIREQKEWQRHADFINQLSEKNVIVIGGPIEGTRYVSLAMIAESIDDVLQKLSHDPWEKMNIIETASVETWDILLGLP